jgi:hypothetical protein
VAPVRPGLLGPVGHLPEGQGVRLGIDLPLGERAEPAPHVAHVREVDVAVHYVGDLVPHRFPAKVVRHPAQGLQGTVLGLEERYGLVVGDGVGTVRLGLPEGRSDRGLDPGRVPPPGGPGPCGLDLEVLEVPVHRIGVPAKARLRALGEGELDGPRLPPNLRVLPRDRVGTLPLPGQAVVAEQRGHRSAHLPGEIRIRTGGVLGVHAQPLPELEPLVRRARPQRLEPRPRCLGIHVVGSHRGHAAPVVDPRVERRW